MADFLKIPNIELIKDNIADKKSYWNEYRTVLEKFAISAESFDLIYSSPRYARIFIRRRRGKNQRKNGSLMRQWRDMRRVKDCFSYLHQSSWR